AGVHFGHQTQRWNPKMRRYIFMERNGIYILDLQKTQSLLERARKRARDIASSGGRVLFVGTKKQARDIVRQAAEDCGQYYVNERWLGGMLTNFQTIRKSLDRFRELERMKLDSTWELISKKERLGIDKELERLTKVFLGIKEMDRLPSALFIVDTVKEKIAVQEANKLGIPVLGVVDTNADPEPISYPIPGNDDAIRSIELLTNAVATAVKEGAAKARDNREAAEKAHAMDRMAAQKAETASASKD
ncbi:MAG: 30S ribosomal protein S2, partial [Gemmatimonadetes bacterium]|nr:30S ribosomal protein S2 [Gemmatimonadota bacterium]